MATYVIVGTNPDGYAKYGWRNVPESQKDDAVQFFVSDGWTNVTAVRESF